MMRNSSDMKLSEAIVTNESYDNEVNLEMKLVNEAGNKW
jgi:hypothetical protein